MTLAKIPAATAGGRAHLEARDPRCDTVVVLNMAARRIIRKRFADMNACAGADADWNLHFPDNMHKNHFTEIIDKNNGRRRPCTHAEANRPVIEIPKHDMVRYRKNVGSKRRPRWVRPFTVAERNRQAKRRWVRICWEIKSRAYATNPALAKRFAAAIKATGWGSYYMTLVSMWGFGLKLKHFKEAGEQTALLGHDHRLSTAEANELRGYYHWIDRQWGAFAAPNHWIRDYVKAA